MNMLLLHVHVADACTGSPVCIFKGYAMDV